jgi:multidrug efflux pump subunit AcrB
MLRLQTTVGANLQEMDKLMRRAEEFVNDRPEVDRAFVVVGGFGGSGVNTGIMFLTLVPPGDREMTQAEFAALLRKELNAIPGLRTVVQDLSQSGFTASRGFPVEFSVRGSDWNQLIAIAGDLRRKLVESGAVVDLDTDYQVGMPELQIVPDRSRAADLGVSVSDIASTVNALVGGIRVGKYSTGGRRVDVRLRLLSTQRSRPEDLARLHVKSGAGQLIPLSTLVGMDEKPVLQTITRRDRERAIGVFGNVAPGHAQGEVLELVEKLGRDLPPGYHVVPGGSSVAFRDSMSGLVFALLLGLIVAYMVLASQFNSFAHPFSVLSILPLAFTGAAIGLWVASATVNVFSMIGVLLLMGIVKKNSIMLVDYANLMKKEGHDEVAAMRIAGPRRLRPILMTSVTTMMSAVPAALALGPGSETRAPMAAAVLGGLIVSTALSLLVVPAFYVLLEQLKGWVAARFTRSPEPSHEDERRRDLA